MVSDGGGISHQSCGTVQNINATHCLIWNRKHKTATTFIKRTTFPKLPATTTRVKGGCQSNGFAETSNRNKPLFVNGCLFAARRALEEPAPNDEAATVPPETLTAKRIDLLTAFHAKYNYRLEYDSEVSGNTISLIAKQHSRRTIEFAPLSSALSVADGRHSAIEPIRRGDTSPFLVDTSIPNIQGRKGIDFNKTPGNFTHAVRVLMYAYARASANDPPGKAWRSIDAARAHIATVETTLERVPPRAGPSGPG